MWLGVLGPLQVQHEAMAIGVPAAKQRIVLGALLVQANQVVSFEQLADVVWDGAGPPGARPTLRNYVKRLRQILGPAVGGRIRTHDPGYVIDVGEDELDLLRFTQLCRSGGAAVRAGSWERAETALGEALRLWRGSLLADVPSDALRRDEVPRLEQLRLQAVEWLLEAQLQLGQHVELVPQLRALVAQHPLHERFYAQLMLACYRSGCRADALAVYHDGRRLLLDELGVEPGPELRSLLQRILAGDLPLWTPPPAESGLTPDRASARLILPGGTGTGPASDSAGDLAAARSGPASTPPRQLPPTSRYFAGRTAELQALDGLLDQVATGGGTVVISAIGGTAGVGKSALALHWAHRVADRFPDGQLYVNLRGFDPSGTPVSPAEAIRGFLDALQVPPAAIPADPQAQAGLYRSLLARRSFLIVLDNARHAQQVRPLVPGAPGCLVVVTSRSRLTGLVASEGAHALTLDLLTDAEASELLALRLGTRRLADEPAAQEELIRLCARLPLALSITTARAAMNPGLSLAAVAAELKEARLDALTTGEVAMDVRAVLSWSYQNLSGPGADMFRLLAVHPGPDICVAAAASLAGLPWPETRLVLAELTGAHLIQETAAGRYAFHDLLRAYAAEQVREGLDETDRRSAVHRMLDYYLHAALSADRQLDPLRDPIAADPPTPGVTVENAAGYAEALSWFRAEHRVLLGVASLAATAGSDAHAWRLPWALTTYLNRCGHWHDWAFVQQIALAATERLKDQAGQARSHNELGRAFLRLGAHSEALAHLRQALAVFAQLGDDGGQARCHLDLGRAFKAAGRHDLALDHGHRVLELAEAAGNQVLRAGALNNIGWYHARLGQHVQALSYCTQALSLFRDIGHRNGEAQTLDSIGYACHHLGQHDQAIAYYRQALAIFRDLGARYDQADLLHHLGETQQAAGHLPAASQTWQRALAILDDMHHPDAAELRAELRLLEAGAAGAPARAT